MPHPIRTLALVATLALPVSASAQTHHFISNSPDIFSTTLTPGAWTLGVTDGVYNQVQGQVGGCDGNGLCSFGWHTEFFYRLDGSEWIEAGYSGSWATITLATQHIPAPVVFDISEDTQLDVTLLDTYYSDNVGTLDVTLADVTSTPEPASTALLATGLFGVVALRRRRRA